MLASATDGGRALSQRWLIAIVSSNHLSATFDNKLYLADVSVIINMHVNHRNSVIFIPINSQK